MYPAYGGGMSSYPYQRTPMPSFQYYHPSSDFISPQVKEDPTASGPSFVYKSWPQNCGYAVPMQCPNCSNHAQNPPAYYNFRPPCPHLSSPQPAYSHFCGGFPPHPQPSYPISYVLPPPHYTMELPRYEYDKKAQGGLHCCGCPNHQCNLKEGKNVKIEEHEPEVETTKSESLVPAGLNNFTQPILWIPPGYVINKEQQHQQEQPRRVVENEADKQHVSPYYYIQKPQWQRRPIETEAEEQQESLRAKKLQLQRRPVETEEGKHVESPRVRKPQQSVNTVEQGPNVRYGWFPLDMNDIRELLEGGQGRTARDRESKGGNEKTIQDVENKEETKQFRFPIIWMPYGGQGENHAKGQEEKDAGEAPSKEASPTFKVIPMKLEHPDNEPEKIKTSVRDDGSGVGKRATEKTISMKTIPVKQLEEPVPKPMKKDEDRKEEGAAVKTAERNGNGHSSSPTKISKLPPICLRVDPPKKKNGNGSSRSPSPPVDKKRHEPEESKTGTSKKEIKVSEAEVNPRSQSKIEVSHKAAGEEKREKHEGDSEIKGPEGQESQGAKESKPQEAKKPERRILSEQEAATIIQSAYHGYDVRRWEPLKKLRQIAKVREEAVEVKRRIDDLESRSLSSLNDREKAIIAETIMKLLLKLDTIQGLHPSFRDVRRSVAKELTVLQEKLDSIINKGSAPVAQETANVEERPKVSGQDEGSKVVIETAEEPSKASTQLEGSNVVETAEEPSFISDLDEISRDIGEIAEESSKVSSKVESSEGEDKNAEVCLEDEVPKFNEVSSVQPLVVGGEKEETVETSEVKMESQNEPQDDSARSSPVPTVADSRTDMKEAADSGGSEAVQGKLAAESLDLSAGIENTVEQADIPSGQTDEQVNLLAEVPLEIVEEDKNEISQLEVNSDIAVRKESIDSAPSALTCEALEVESEKEQRDEESNLQAEIELPEEVTEEGVKEQTSEFPSSETVNIEQEEDQSAGDVKGEATQAIEPESCKPDPSELLSINEDQKVLESEPLEIAIPISEQDDHMPEEPAVEKAAHVEESGPQVSEVHGGLLKPEEDEETKLIPHADGIELNSTMASRENQVSHDEDAHEFIGVIDQDRTSEERVSVIDQPTVPAPENVKGQSVRSETEAPQVETQQPKHEEVTSKEQPKEGGQDEEEQIDKRVIEENQKLRETVERLIASGKEQQDVISSLSGKLRDLEKKLARKKNKIKSTRRPRVVVSRASCGKPSNGSLSERPMGVAL